MAIQAEEIKILDQLLLVDLSGIHLWTARKKLKKEMFEGKTPPENLASLGSMCGFHDTWTLSPRSFGHSFHAHLDT
ncbi:TPA: DUF3150 domain-containing protein [Pseudomonas aeruginosa]